MTIPTISAYLNASGASKASSTHFTNTVEAAARLTTEAYIQFASAKGTTKAFTAVAVGVSTANLAISGTDKTASGTGDDESGVKEAADATTLDAPTKTAIAAKKVDNIAALTS